MVAIVSMLYCKKRYVLGFAGIACILLKLNRVSLHYTNSHPEIWGVLQRLSFILTTAWLFAVHLTTKRQTSRDVSTRHSEVADRAIAETILTPETRGPADFRAAVACPAGSCALGQLTRATSASEVQLAERTELSGVSTTGEFEVALTCCFDNRISS